MVYGQIESNRKLDNDGPSWQDVHEGCEREEFTQRRILVHIKANMREHRHYTQIWSEYEPIYREEEEK